MNKFIIIGNLVADPELRKTNNNIAVCQFRVAVARKFKDANGEKAVDYIPVVCWRQLAELCNQYLAKGKKVGVSGSLQTRNYEDKQGNKRTAFELQAEDIEFLTPKSEQAESTNYNAGFTEADDIDLPF